MGNLKDFATGTVAVAPSPASSGTTIEVQTGEGGRYPATPFSATVHPDGQLPTLDNAEKVTVTNISDDTLTITRAQGSTTAKNITAGWRISNTIFEADFTSKQNVPAEGAFVDGDKTKLDGIEALADVTDSTNVAAAGAYMKATDDATDVSFDGSGLGMSSTDVQGAIAEIVTGLPPVLADKISYDETTTANMDFVVDEDNMASNSATKVPTQQSVKAYVDNEVAPKIEEALHVGTTSPADTGILWVDTDDESTGLNITDLDGVDIESPTSGSLLVYNGTNWANASSSPGIPKTFNLGTHPFFSSVSNTTTETSLNVFTLPANTIENNFLVSFNLTGAITNTSGSTVTYTYRVKFGSLIWSVFSFDVPTGSTNVPFKANIEAICLDFSGLRLAGGGTINVSSGAAGTNDVIIRTVTTAVDPIALTTNVPITLTAQMSLANANASFNAYSSTISVVNPAPAA